MVCFSYFYFILYHLSHSKTTNFSTSKSTHNQLTVVFHKLSVTKSHTAIPFIIITISKIKNPIFIQFI